MAAPTLLQCGKTKACYKCDTSAVRNIVRLMVEWFPWFPFVQALCCCFKKVKWMLFSSAVRLYSLYVVWWTCNAVVARAKLLRDAGLVH